MAVTRVVTSTSDLTPDGWAGYAKGIVAFAGLLGAALAIIIPYLDPTSDWARWVGGAVALCAWIGTIAVPNQVKPEAVTPAAPGGFVSPPAGA